MISKCSGLRIAPCRRLAQLCDFAFAASAFAGMMLDTTARADSQYQGLLNPICIWVRISHSNAGAGGGGAARCGHRKAGCGGIRRGTGFSDWRRRAAVQQGGAVGPGRPGASADSCRGVMLVESCRDAHQLAFRGMHDVCSPARTAEFC